MPDPGPPYLRDQPKPARNTPGLLSSFPLLDGFGFASSAEGWNRLRARAGSLGFWRGGHMAD